MSWTVEEAYETYDVFKIRTAEDPEFRALALKDPEAAVKQLSGLDLPDNLDLQVTENMNGELEVSMLFLSPAGEEELDETELIETAGGAAYGSLILQGQLYMNLKK
ncbi:hypothetical protein [Paenibacillus pinihumi]|uniref:hypothetical protein n=1 Tax=Paenibacillus pinihumi TaxID=669462 RepID=UPI000429CB83|nr:hypothetical protein [Paenibacillus pinihumi]